MSVIVQNIKRVCIYGVGGVGGYYAALMARAFQKQPSSEREIYLIARGEHLRAIREKGLTLKTPQNVTNIVPNAVTSDVQTIPPPDLILLCTKSYDLQTAVEAIRPQMKQDTVIIPLLNGIDIYQRIRSVLKDGFILPSCVYLGTHIESPGVINQSGGNGIILSGRDPQFADYDVRELKGFFEELGIGFEWHESPFPAIWEKFIFIAAFGLVTAFTGKTLGEVVENPELKNLTQCIMQEIAAIAAKKEIGLPADIVESSLKKAGNFPHDARTSYQRDIESWPKSNEGDLYGGAIMREGAAAGVPTPVTERIYSRILRFEFRL